jgi:bifunctional DNase/RNase
MIEVVLRAVRVDVGSATPLLLLEEVGGSRVLPIFIGAPEATAIAYALQHIETPRPMTHDLLYDVIVALGARLSAIEIVDLVDNTFYANLRLAVDEGEILVSARPSDAVALAIRSRASLYVGDDLMDEEAQYIEVDEVDEDDEDETAGESAPSEAELLAELRSFLDQVRPEDFDQ